MIRVERAPRPSILGKKGPLWRKRLLEARQACTSADNAQTRRALERAETKYRHPEVKAALVAMFHGKCGYCESKITHIDYGHIEHYRPKSRFPEQTFDWPNLLLACGVCNGAEHKGDHFPTSEEGGPLLNPGEDAPESHLEFRYSRKAKLASVSGKTRRGRTTVRLMGLNRPELRAFRSRQVQRLLALARLAERDEAARALVEEARLASEQYAAFARHCTLR